MRSARVQSEPNLLFKKIKKNNNQKNKHRGCGSWEVTELQHLRAIGQRRAAHGRESLAPGETRPPRGNLKGVSEATSAPTDLPGEKPLSICTRDGNNYFQMSALLWSLSRSRSSLRSPCERDTGTDVSTKASPSPRRWRAKAVTRLGEERPRIPPPSRGTARLENGEVSPLFLSPACVCRNLKSR